MKLTIFEFVGGAWDGMNLSTLSPDPTEAAIAAHVLEVTRDGSRGRVVMMSRKYAIRKGCCRYVVTNHISVNGESLIRLECDESDCRDATDQPHKTIILQFVGGCLDGRTLRSDAADMREALIATSYYCLTNEGSVCAILKVHPCLCGQIQGGLCRVSGVLEYRVMERSKKDAAINVVLQYMEPKG
jgi:hypothetical protein